MSNNEYSVSASDRTDATDISHITAPVQPITNHKQTSSYNSSSSQLQQQQINIINDNESPQQPPPPQPQSSYSNGLEKISEANTVDHGIDMGRHDHEWNRRNTNHLKATKEADPNNGYAHKLAESSDSVQSVKIALNLNNGNHQNGDITPPTHQQRVTPIGISHDVIAGQFGKATTITPEPSLSGNNDDGHLAKMNSA
eukprot:182581_1